MLTVNLEVRKITDETALAFEIHIVGEKDPIWIPKSEITNADAYRRGEVGVVISVTVSFLKEWKRGEEMAAPATPVGHHHSRETFPRHAGDMAIRAAGFEILSRPEKGPVLWKKGNRPYTQEQALAVVTRVQQERPSDPAKP